ncbi:hypothetical protein FOCC_FOCC005492 [Frankliniella occidentalis]|nr:hypothetical protein FOCC_FOCC005492 [Frankliniella occidentalis]
MRFGVSDPSVRLHSMLQVLQLQQVSNEAHPLRVQQRASPVLSLLPTPHEAPGEPQETRPQQAPFRWSYIISARNAAYSVHIHGIIPMPCAWEYLWRADSLPVVLPTVLGEQDDDDDGQDDDVKPFAPTRAPRPHSTSSSATSVIRGPSYHGGRWNDPSPAPSPTLEPPVPLPRTSLPTIDLTQFLL